MTTKTKQKELAKTSKDIPFLNWEHLKAVDEDALDYTGLTLNLLQQPYIIGFSGYKGSGKTLTMAAICAWAMAVLDYPVWSNFDIKFKTRPNNGRVKTFESLPLDLDEIFMFSESVGHGIVAIDELPMFAESRRSSGTANRLMNYFIMQSRKRVISFFYSAQDIAWVDKRIQWSTDVLCKCKDAAKTPTGLQANVKYGSIINIDVYDHSGQWTGDIDYESPTVELDMYAERFWDIYDTYQTIDPFEAMRGVDVDLERRRITDKQEEVIDYESIKQKTYQLFDRENRVKPNSLWEHLGITNNNFVRQKILDYLSNEIGLEKRNRMFLLPAAVV